MFPWQSPAIVVAFLTWLFSPPTGFADAARREAVRRELLPKATRALTSQDVAGLPSRPLPTGPAVSGGTSGANPTPAAPAAANKDIEPHDEAWWHARIASARETLERDQLLAESLQSRVNALTNEAPAEDDPAHRGQLYERRTRVLAELEHMKGQIVADQKSIEAISDDARTQNVPAGWIRK